MTAQAMRAAGALLSLRTVADVDLTAVAFEPLVPAVLSTAGHPPLALDTGRRNNNIFLLHKLVSFPKEGGR
jgi:hypothetical protein